MALRRPDRWTDQATRSEAPVRVTHLDRCAPARPRVDIARPARVSAKARFYHGVHGEPLRMHGEMDQAFVVALVRIWRHWHALSSRRTPCILSVSPWCSVLKPSRWSHETSVPN